MYRFWIFILAFLFGGVLCLFGFSDRFARASDETILEETTEWNGDRTLSGTITIRGNVYIPVSYRVTIAAGSVVQFDDGRLTVGGTIDFRGTPERPIETKSKSGSHESYSLSVSGTLRARNTTFQNGGSGPVYLLWNFFIPTAYAYGERGVIDVLEGGSIDVAHCEFLENKVDISMHGGSARVWANVFRGADIAMVQRFDTHNQNSVDFRYNFWDGKNPETLKGNTLPNTLETGEWTSSDVMRDPVILVPGIVGSYQVMIPQNEEDAWRETGKTEWALDPLLGTYDALYKTFEKNGYTKNETLFMFPYDWKRSNVDTADDLSDRIAEIVAKTHRPFVDVVSHSMGGLVVRQYIQSDGYRGDIDQLIMLGTPNLGAPDAYLKWEGGFLPVGIWKNRFEKYVFESWAKHSGYESIFDYIRGDNLVSIQQLLPIRDYLYERKGDDKDKRSYPEGYPKNEFLEALDTINIEALREVTMQQIVGNEKKKTITGIIVSDVDKGEMWKDGYPEGVENFLTQGNSMIYDAGDETVPLASARADHLFSDEIVEISDAAHMKLPSLAKDRVYRMLTGSDPKKKDATWVDKILGVFAFSPIDMQLVAPDGKRVGKNFETGGVYAEIPGAYYAGFATSSEFITIQNPLDGEYVLKTQGVSGGGAYTVKAVVVADGKDDQLFEQSGIAQEGEVETKALFFGAKKSESESMATVNGGETVAVKSDDIATNETSSEKKKKSTSKSKLVSSTQKKSENVSNAQTETHIASLSIDPDVQNISGTTDASEALPEVSRKEELLRTKIFLVGIFFVIALLLFLLKKGMLQKFCRDFREGWRGGRQNRK